MMFVSLGTTQAQTTFEILYINKMDLWLKSRPKSDPAIWKNVRNLDDDCTYVGEVSSGLPNIFGRLTCPEHNFKYVGEFKNGKQHGQGAETFASDKYVGGFKNGKYHGQGFFTYESGQKYIGEYKDGKYHGQGTKTASSGAKYVGEYKDGKRHGQGTLTVPNGEKYVGEWKDDKAHGKGTITTTDGQVIKGIFIDGELVGQQFKD